MDRSLPGSSVHRTLQERILEWITIPPPRDLPDPGIEPGSLRLLRWQVASLPPAGSPAGASVGRPVPVHGADATAASGREGLSGKVG